MNNIRRMLRFSFILSIVFLIYFIFRHADILFASPAAFGIFAEYFHLNKKKQKPKGIMKFHGQKSIFLKIFI